MKLSKLKFIAKKLPILMALGMSFMTAQQTHAELYSHKLSLIAGTLGVGGEYAFEALETFTVRGSAQGGKWSYSTSAADIDFDAELDLLSFGLQADFTPLGGGPYATAGVFYNKNAMTLSSTTDHVVSHGGTNYDMKVTSSSDVSFNPFSPYLGGGFKLGLLGVMDFYVEGGIMSHGTPSIETSLSQTNNAPDAVTNNLTIPADVRDNITTNANNAVEKFKIYPVLKIAGSIKF